MLNRCISIPIIHAMAVALLLLSCAQPAAAQGNGTEVVDNDAMVRANRTMKRIDKNGDGKFEKSEAKGIWRRLGHLDKNKDEVITVEELRHQSPIYLENGGKRKLDVVYKQVSGRDLKLDLYYPTNQSAADTSPHPVIIYTHGGGWAAGSKQGIAKGSFKVVFKKLLDHGFAVASINYRLCNKKGTVMMRDCVIDSKDAVRYLAKNDGRFGWRTDCANVAPYFARVIAGRRRSSVNFVQNVGRRILVRTMRLRENRIVQP